MVAAEYPLRVRLSLVWDDDASPFSAPPGPTHAAGPSGAKTACGLLVAGLAGESLPSGYPVTCCSCILAISAGDRLAVEALTARAAAAERLADAADALDVAHRRNGYGVGGSAEEHQAALVVFWAALEAWREVRNG